MRIIIVGGGKVGAAIATQLAKEDHDIVLIDKDRAVLKKLGEALDMMVIYGNGASLSVQREADVAHSDLLIAVGPLDELNMMCCLIARKLGCKNTIARVRDPEYVEQIYFLQDELGLNMTINPEWAAAGEIFRLTQIPAFLKRESFAKGRAEIVEIEIVKGGILDGIRLSELPAAVKVKVLVCAVRRDGEVHIPSGSFTLQAGDKIHVTSAATELIELVRGIGLRQHRTKSVLVVGGGKIAQYLCQMLVKSGTRVKIIEKSRERSMQLAELLPRVTVINADGSSQPVLLSEGVEQMDTVVTLTDIDEENIIISMYSNYIGVPQVITKINRTEYNEVLQTKGIDRVISPKLLCANSIISYVRAMQHASGGAVLAVHMLADGHVEALEFEVSASARHVGERLMDLPLKNNLLIVCINRRGKVIIPGGSDTIEHGDTVVVVSSGDEVLWDLNNIFLEEIVELPDEL